MTTHMIAGGHRYFTPLGIAALVRDLLRGRIELDPCSEAQANHLVRAERFYTARDRAEFADKSWVSDTCYVNPPGGRAKLGQKFWRKLCEGHSAGDIKVGAFLSFSLDYLQTTQRHTAGGILRYPTFVFKVRFEDPFWVPGPRGPVPSPEAFKPCALTIMPRNFLFLSREQQDLAVAELIGITHQHPFSGVWVGGAGFTQINSEVDSCK